MRMWIGSLTAACMEVVKVDEEAREGRGGEGRGGGRA